MAEEKMGSVYEQMGRAIAAVFKVLAKDKTVPESITAQCPAALDEWAAGKFEVDDLCQKDGITWRCCQAHDSTVNIDVVPGQAPAQWVMAHSKNPRRCTEYMAVTGAHDTWQKGECCIWGDGVKRSKIDNNAYAPDVRPDDWEDVPKEEYMEV